MDSKKRTLAEYGFVVYPSSKKRRLLDPPTRLAHKSDLIESATYFKAIERSPLTRSLSIPRAINLEIAEFATGTLVGCPAWGCDASSCELYGDDRVKGRDGRCRRCGHWRCAFHDEHGECDSKHASCCEMIAYCVKCDKLTCSGCDDFTWFCDSCCETTCDACWSSSSDNRSYCRCFWDMWMYACSWTCAECAEQELETCWQPYCTCDCDRGGGSRFLDSDSE